MSTPQNQIIAAIRRIAKEKPEVSTELDSIKKRGRLTGDRYSFASDSDDSCCSGDVVENDGSNNAPDPNGDGSGWTDCTTGQPVTFDPNGFPRAETCKECEPDGSWTSGYYAFASSSLVGTVQAASPYAVWAQAPDSFEYLGGMYIKDSYAGDGVQPFLTYTREDTGQGHQPSQGRFEVCQQSDYDSGLCTEDRPERCDIDWEADNTTNYALIDGCITASSCDPEASEQSQQCNECITICNSAGEEHEICAGPDDSYLDNGLYGSWSGYY